MQQDAIDVSSVSVSLIVFVNALSESIQCDCRSHVGMAQMEFPFRVGLSVTERSIETYMGCWEIRLDDAFSLGEFGSFFDLISEIVHCECSCRV